MLTFQALARRQNESLEATVAKLTLVINSVDKPNILFYSTDTAPQFGRISYEPTTIKLSSVCLVENF